MANTPFTTAFNAANGAYAATNAAFNTTNTAYNFANTVNTFAYGVAVNSAAAFAAANNVAPQVTPAFLTGNLAYALANNAYASINSNWTVTNALYSVANSAYGAANNVGPQIAPTYNTANAAYTAANNNNTYATSTFVALTAPNQTITGNLAVTGTLTLLGNTTSISSNNLIVGDSMIYLAANNYSGTDILDIGFVANYANGTGANVHTGLIRDATSKQYYLFQGLDIELFTNNTAFTPGANGVVNAVLNADLVTSNLTLGGANTINWIKVAFDTANAAYASQNADYISSNSAYTVVNAAYASINSNWTVTNTVYGVANAAFGLANTALTTSNYNSYVPTLTGTGASGTWGISITGSSASASFVNAADTRSVTTTRETTNQGVKFDFKQNGTNALSDGGLYHGLMTYRQYGSGTDWSGGASHQIGFTDNGNIWQRSGSSTSWNAWKKMLDDTNYTSYAAFTTNITGTGTHTLTTVPNYRNTPNIASDYTVSNTYNEMSIGPININNGVTVTVDNNASWVIV